MCPKEESNPRIEFKAAFFSTATAQQLAHTAHAHCTCTPARAHLHTHAFARTHAQPHTCTLTLAWRRGLPSTPSSCPPASLVPSSCPLCKTHNPMHPNPSLGARAALKWFIRSTLLRQPGCASCASQGGSTEYDAGVTLDQTSVDSRDQNLIPSGLPWAHTPLRTPPQRDRVHILNVHCALHTITQATHSLGTCAPVR